jgi:hypothetical protein
MAWVLLVVALALVTGYLIITFGYRTSVIVFLVTLVIGLVVVIWYAEFHQGTSSDLVGPGEVGMDNFRVEVAYRNSYKMFARVRNDSPEYTLTAVVLEVNASDCPTETVNEDCLIVGQQQREIPVSVPPKQARDITHQFNFPPMRPQGVLMWSFDVKFVKAQK